ncbi:MAG: hypothetical protein Q8P11_01075 [bacterium]|nr:hypothetical protein [bacterium]
MNMLEQLFGSRTRTKLLKLFLTNPHQAFYIRELTRVIDTQINSVRRELTNLEDCGLIITVSEEEAKRGMKDLDDPNRMSRLLFGGIAPEVKESVLEDKADKQAKKYYRVDPTFVLYKELRALFEKSPLIVERDLSRVIDQMGTVQYGILTGFFVGLLDSPVDILLVGTVNKTLWDSTLKRVEQEIDQDLKYTIMPLEEFKMRKSVTDRFLFTVLEGPKKVLIDTLLP